MITSRRNQNNLLQLGRSKYSVNMFNYIMDLKIYKINNGYKIGKKDGTRLDEKYGRRYYITKKPMRRDTAKILLMKLQLEERGMRIQVKSKKKKFQDGYMIIDPKKTKRKWIYTDLPCNEFKEFLITF